MQTERITYPTPQTLIWDDSIIRTGVAGPLDVTYTAKRGIRVFSATDRLNGVKVVGRWDTGKPPDVRYYEVLPTGNMVVGMAPRPEHSKAARYVFAAMDQFATPDGRS